MAHDHWSIIKALTWLATGEALDMRQYIEKGEPDLDQQRVCNAARDDRLKILGCPGIGARLNGVPREFGHPVRIDPNAFVDASISFYGLSYLRNPRGLSVFYHLTVDSAEFAKWANSRDAQSLKSKVKLIKAPSKKTGPKGIKGERIKAEMRAMDRADLDAMKDEELAAQFGASKSHCVNLRTIVLAENN
jgi:hypothetical protein